MKNTLKNWIETILGIVLFSMASFLVKQYLSKPPSLYKELMEIASEVNKTLPIMIDRETQLDNTISKSPNVFQYNHSLINFEKENLDVLELKNELEPKILNTVRTNPNLQYFRDKDVVINYYYKDKNGMFLLEITVTPEQYKSTE